MTARQQGWAIPGAARKAHYFAHDSLISLCGKWMHSGPREDTMHDHKDNCVPCWRKREKLKAEAKAADQ